MITKLTGLLFVSLLAHAATTQKSETVAWITQCNGDWEDRTNADHPVKIACNGVKGELWFPLQAQSHIALISRKPKLWINIRIARTGERHRFDCDKPGACEPSPLPFAKHVPKEETPNLLQVFLTSPGKPYARIRLMLSKAENDDTDRITVDHAVIAEDKKIPLRDLLREKTPAGDYLLELCPFDEKNGCPRDGKPLSLKWSPGSSTTWPQPVKAGIYEIVLNKVEAGITMRTKDRGFLLVVPAKRMDDTVKAVASGEQLFLKTWKDQSEGRLMFRALLVHLSSTGQ